MTKSRNGEAIAFAEEPILTGLEQAAGHRRDTACKAAQHWSRSCGSAWISRYVLATKPNPTPSPSPSPRTSACSHHTARQGPEEEHHQLPPFENVPQDHRPSQAQLGGISVAAHAALYTICIPTVRHGETHDAPARNAGGVLSAITTLGRRSGEVGTVYICNLREGEKSTNQQIITYPSMETRTSASEHLLTLRQTMQPCATY